jgi:D-alanine-D-alanine ligase
MDRKIRVGVLFGGKSAEHEISLLSARSIVEALDRNKYEVVLIGIDKNGEWHQQMEDEYLLNRDDPKKITLKESDEAVALVPKENGEQLVSLTTPSMQRAIDVVFPVLHGTYGEDGTVQGLLKLAGVPFVGASVLGSAIGMDKDVMKRLLRDAGIAVAKFLVCTEEMEMSFESVKTTLGVPFFVKPANAGSSVGVSKVDSEEQFASAIALSFKYDHKIIIEECICGREIECSVLGNQYPIASLPGEVIPQHDYYSYEAKYLDEKGALFEIPVHLPHNVIEGIQMLAVQAYRTLCCEGMARVDFFLKETGEIYVNEINTIPGFTKISMYPKLWEVSGLPFAELVDRLIALAIERFERENKLNFNWKENHESAHAISSGSGSE